MSNNTTSTYEMEADAIIKYGVTLAPFENDAQRTEFFLEAYRGACGSQSGQECWVETFPLSAIKALDHPGCTEDDRHLLFYDIVRLMFESDQILDPETWEVWIEAERQWRGVYYSMYKLDAQTGLPSVPITFRDLPPVFSGCVTDSYVTPPSSQSSPMLAPVKEKKKPGRKPGQKDVRKRAARGTKSHLTGAQRSKDSREGAKLRKALLQEQQQQQLTPPSG